MAMIVRIHDGVAITKIPIDKPILHIGRDPGSDIYKNMISTTIARREWSPKEEAWWPIK